MNNQAGPLQSIAVLIGIILLAASALVGSFTAALFILPPAESDPIPEPTSAANNYTPLPTLRSESASSSATEPAIPDVTEEATTEATEESSEEATEEATAEATEETSADTASEVDAEEALTLMQSTGCLTCHVAEGRGNNGPGPNLNGLAQRVQEEYEVDQSVEEYIEESILMTNAFIAPECPTGPCIAGVMPNNYDSQLSDEEVQLMVDYIASLPAE